MLVSTNNASALQTQLADFGLAAAAVCQPQQACTSYLLDPARGANHDVWALVLILKHVLLRLDVHAAKEVADLDVQGLAEALKLTANLQGARTSRVTRSLEAASSKST
mgnify:CR=1 FL=1